MAEFIRNEDGTTVANMDDRHRRLVPVPHDAPPKAPTLDPNDPERVDSRGRKVIQYETWEWL
jgi:hypothetical protein